MAEQEYQIGETDATRKILEHLTALGIPFDKLEHEVVMELTGCMPGAVPPFGNLFGLKVYMDDALLAEDTVYFNCGSHTVSLRMGREDLAKATGAEVASFAQE